MGRYKPSVKREEYQRVPGGEVGTDGSSGGGSGSGGDGADGGGGDHVSWRRLLREAAPQKWTIGAATVALAVSSAANLMVPALFGDVIDSLTGGSVASAQAASNGGDGGADTSAYRAALAAAITQLTVVSLVGAAASFLRGYLFTVAGERVVCELRRKLFEALLAQEIGFYDQSRVGELVSRLSGDTSILRDAATVNLSMALRQVVTVVGGVAYLAVVSWKLTAVMLVIVPGVAVAARLYGRYAKALSKEARGALAEAAQVADESLGAMRTVRSFAAEARVAAAFNAKVAETLRLGVRSSLAYGAFNGGTTALTSLAFIVMVYYGGTLVLSGELSSGVLTSFLLYSLTIGGALASLAGLYGTTMAAIGANDRVFHVLDRVPLVPRDRGRPLLERPHGDLVARDVTFAYPARPDVPVLRGMNFHIAAGQVAAFVGPSGGGKSTVIALLERFYDPSSGSILVDGHDVRDLDGSSLRRHIGLVQQEPTLFACSIRDNIAYGKPGASQEEVEAAARVANAHDFIAGLPSGYDTLVGERGVRLSGGQRQRVAIARAVLQDPAILALDEATSALDAESEHLVKEALERLMVGRTVAIVAHRLSTVVNAAVVFVVDAGVVVASGTHAHLLGTNALYARLVRHQLQNSVADAAAATAAAAAAVLPADGSESPSPSPSPSSSRVGAAAPVYAAGTALGVPV